MSRKTITVTQDETFTGGLCLVAIEPVSNFIILEQLAQARDQDTWNGMWSRGSAGQQWLVMGDPSEVRSDAFESASHRFDHQGKRRTTPNATGLAKRQHPLYPTITLVGAWAPSSASRARGTQLGAGEKSLLEVLSAMPICLRGSRDSWADSLREQRRRRSGSPIFMHYSIRPT